MGATSQSTSSDASARPTRRRLSVNRRREELLTAALELFSQRDVDEVSIDDVAAAAGASRALVYHYFGGKQELYLAAIRSAARELERRLAPTTGGPPLDLLADGLTRYFDFVEQHAAGFAALLRGGPANRAGEVGEIVEQVRNRVQSVILHELRIDHPGPILRVTLRSWIASVETAGLDWLEHRDMDRGVLERMLVDHMIALLGVAANHDAHIKKLFDELIAVQYPSLVPTRGRGLSTGTSRS